MFRTVRVGSREILVVARAQTPSLAAIALIVIGGLWLFGSPISNPSPESRSASAGTALATIASVSGVFLALYFAVVGTVIGTTYTASSPETRDVLLQRVSQSGYLWLVSAVAAISVALLAAMHSLSVEPGYMTEIIAALAILSIFGFSQLGTQLFHFVEPVRVVPHLANDVRWAIQDSTLSAPLYTYPVIQGHCRNIADANSIAVIQMLPKSQPSNSVRDRRGVSIIGELSELALFYLASEPRIPPESDWFPKRPTNPTWHGSRLSAVDIAIAANVSLPQNFETHHGWLSTRLIEAITGWTICELKAPNYKTAARSLDLLQPLSSAYARAWHTETAAAIWRPISQALFESKQSETDRDLPILERIALADRVLSLPVAAIAGFAQSISSIDSHALTTNLNRVDWKSPESIFATLAGATVSDTYWRIVRGIEFEIEVHADRISTNAYLRSLLLNRYCQQIAEVCTHFSENYASIHTEWSSRLRSDGRVYEAFLATSRGLENTSKLTRALTDARTLFDELKKDASLCDIRLGEPNWDQILQVVTKQEDILIGEIASCVPGMLSQVDTDGLPDFLGEAVTRLSIATVSAMSQGNIAFFTKLVPAVAAGTLAVVQRVAGPTHTEADATKARVAAISEFCDVCGYAKAWSELHGDSRYWDLVTGAWEHLVDDDAFMIFTHAAIELSSSPFGFQSDRQSIQFEWKRQLASALKDLPRTAHDPSAPDRFSRLDHSSPLLRAIAGADPDMLELHMATGCEIFVECFLADKGVRLGLTFEARGLRDDLARQDNS